MDNDLQYYIITRELRIVIEGISTDVTIGSESYHDIIRESEDYTAMDKEIYCYVPDFVLNLPATVIAAHHLDKPYLLG